MDISPTAAIQGWAATSEKSPPGQPVVKDHPDDGEQETKEPEQCPRVSVAQIEMAEHGQQKRRENQGGNVVRIGHGFRESPSAASGGLRTWLCGRRLGVGICLAETAGKSANPNEREQVIVPYFASSKSGGYGFRRAGRNCRVRALILEPPGDRVHASNVVGDGRDETDRGACPLEGPRGASNECGAREIPRRKKPRGETGDATPSG